MGGEVQSVENDLHFELQVSADTWKNRKATMREIFFGLSRSGYGALSTCAFFIRVRSSGS